MNEPKDPAEFFCVLRKLIGSGAFDAVGSRQDVSSAMQEIARAMFQSAANGTTPSACERLVGSLFVRSVEQSELPSTLVTLSDANPEGS